MKKQLLTAILTLCMALTFLPIRTLAADKSAAFSAPTVTELTVTYLDEGTEQTVDLLGDQPQVVLPAGSKPVFTVSFDSAQRLNQVFITSTKDGAIKYLEAFPAGGNTYVTDGWFDEHDTDYLPGTIGVAYTKKVIGMTRHWGTEPDIDMAAIKTKLEEQGISTGGGIIAEEGGDVSANIVFSANLTELDDVCITASVSELHDTEEDSLHEWLGVYYDPICCNTGNDCSSYQLTGADGGTYTLYFAEAEWEDQPTAIILLQSENNYARLLLTIEPGHTFVGSIEEPLEKTYSVCSELLDYCGIFSGIDQLLGLIHGSDALDELQRLEAAAKIGALSYNKNMFLLGTVCLSMFADLAPDENIPDTPPLLFSAILNCYTDVVNSAWKYRIGMIQGCPPIEGVFSAETAEVPEVCEHAYIPIVTAPTCTERGFTTYTCGKCGETYTADDTDALGHNWGEWVTINYPTAFEDGLRQRTCPLCGTAESDAIPAAGSSSSDPSGEPNQPDTDSSLGSSGSSASDSPNKPNLPNADSGPGASGSSSSDSSGEPGRPDTDSSPGSSGSSSSDSSNKPNQPDADSGPGSSGSSASDPSSKPNQPDTDSSPESSSPSASDPSSKPNQPDTDSSPGFSGTVITSTNSGNGSASAVTTIVPTTIVNSDTASAVFTSAGIALLQIRSNHSSEVVIAPEIPGSVNRTEVSLPCSFLNQIGNRTDADLVIRTPAAQVAISNDSLRNLDADGMVTVTTERNNNVVRFSISSGMRDVESIPVTLTVSMDRFSAGATAVLLHRDGSRQIIRKSVVKDDSLIIPLSGSAMLEIIDNTKYFYDVPDEHWASNAVSYVSGHELFSGTGIGVFAPNAPMTRGMLAVVLHNLEGNPNAGYSNSGFLDVDADSWSATAIAWASGKGIISGYGNGLFGPDNNITREQLAVMLWRYAGSPVPICRDLTFSDMNEADSYSLDALRWAAECGILNGYEDNRLGPKEPATRAQTAQTLKTFAENTSFLTNQ